MLLLGEAADKRDNSSCKKLRTTEYVDILAQPGHVFEKARCSLTPQLFSYTQDKVHISAVLISKSGQLIPK